MEYICRQLLSLLTLHDKYMVLCCWNDCKMKYMISLQEKFTPTHVMYTFFLM
ncbi:hypothetical protein GQ55_7G089000 [Panicum hallii var. hallii]|uniref:Uncharacterized protein n=1 Tax=Panicum hallii var. hallii TaxID=1504633 RepID=A0A2T7CTA6_9POAL|nr:hypothetical protein GQ55_7G089000 [Panicum hallii var. hallii]